MTTDDKKSKKAVNEVADSFNWEQRIKGEIEAPQKWSENWGPYFKGDIPLEIGDRIKYFESELKKIPANSIHPPKYGVGEPFPEIGPSHRRKVASFNKS